MLFKDVAHEDAFNQFIEEMELTKEEVNSPNELLRKQLAFLYLIAIYRKEYIEHEGCAFYIENYGELSLGGPTYLLEDEIGNMTGEHEYILAVAKQILKGDEPIVTNIPKEVLKFVEEAKRMAA